MNRDYQESQRRNCSPYAAQQNTGFIRRIHLRSAKPASPPEHIQSDVAMDRGPAPIQRRHDPAMLKRIVMNIIDMPGEILIVTDQVFPKPPLPEIVSIR